MLQHEGETREIPGTREIAVNGRLRATPKQPDLYVKMSQSSNYPYAMIRTEIFKGL
jgi:hypothetical protein